jgi:steroid delta-isomerase-like uncharacterized protein
VDEVFEENVAATRRLFEEAWNQGNLGVINELCADDFVDHDPVMGDSDREGVKQLVSSYRDAFPDLEIVIEDVVADGDKVAFRWTANGTFENAIMGQEPTGERGDPIGGIGIDRFEDGKVAESWGQWDTLAFMKNIGAMPAETTAAAE